jgi:Ca2+-binding RTX toxin-like protein
MALCQPASAGMVGYESYNGRGDVDAYVFFTGSPGEANDVTVTLTPLTATIVDPGKVLQPDPAHAGTSGHCTFNGDKAVCRTDGEPFAVADLALGDRNDRGRVVSGAAQGGWIGGAPQQQSGWFDGGPGNDVLIGSVGDDSFTGGPGADDIQGGGGIRDSVSYSEDGDQLTGVNVTLDDKANDGHPGEKDNAHLDVEFAEGTLQGDNVLRGNAQDNALFGHTGNDALFGGAGNDTLQNLDLFAGNDVMDGGAGLDTFIGSEGDDVMHAQDSLPDLRISCNGGNDTVFADAVDPVDPDCETVHTG